MNLTWSTDSTGPRKFLSVHGRRAAVFGYGEAPYRDAQDSGLEIWAYPVQILRGYRVIFHSRGSTTGIEGSSLLRRIEYTPQAVTRIYAGPDFIVREHIFVPLEEGGAVVSYEVNGARTVDIEIRFIPVLDVMWPASIGGQETLWDDHSSAYVLSELTHRFHATVSSPDIVAHDDTPNRTQPLGKEPGLGFTISARAGHKVAQVIIIGERAENDVNTTEARLRANADALEESAIDHYANLLDHSLQIETPDANVNRALAWSEIAMDQAWVCNPDLGCGLVAGYGASRKARRPQYDWFFAGDGMVTMRGLLAAGQYDRAREELEFILKNQDRKSGMIWHEMSQSAGLIDWSKYPYMFVHVDLTFDFINAVGEYFSTTGDREFMKTHWPSIEAAYSYCRSLLETKDGLPRIPADKQGGDEQDQLSDDLSLSANWAAAAHTFAELANSMNDPSLTQAAKQANEASERAITSIRSRYWDERRHLPISSFTRSGEARSAAENIPAKVNGQTLFPDAENELLLNRLASADFQTDWGTRSHASSATDYDPNSYAKGGVWATHTAAAASEFWRDHRPATALPIWYALVPWASLDSPGHIHEVLAGDYYHEEEESVPEQTWSSSTFLSAAVSGLLGIQIRSDEHQLIFAPHLPPGWNGVTVRNLRVGNSLVGAAMTRSDDSIFLQMQNDGPPVEVVFDPQIPLGAVLKSATFQGKPIQSTPERHAQDAHASVHFELSSGKASINIHYEGGVDLIPEPPSLSIGEPSRSLKITGINLYKCVLTINADSLSLDDSSFQLRTVWPVSNVNGATLKMISPALYRLDVSRSKDDQDGSNFHGTKIVVAFRQNSNCAVSHNAH